jgi:hypothetical protein
VNVAEGEDQLRRQREQRNPAVHAMSPKTLHDIPDAAWML